jgi:hypothetical protein
MNAFRARVVGFAVVVAALAALTAPTPVRAADAPDMVRQWNLNAIDALMVKAAQDPRLVVLHLAMVHGAVYDAVNAIDGG